jgi:superfamily I DNA/RNA helicase
VARTRYLLAKELAQPSQIFILAYNTTTAADISERLEALAIADVNVSTFHAFGYGMLKAASA